MIYQIFESLDEKFGVERAKAHCDVPCGIYDPIVAQISALTVVRMIDLIQDLESKSKGNHDTAFFNSMTRYITVKEEHAEKAKAEIRVIWGDYIKAAHIENHPELPGLVHKIMQLGSTSRQTSSREHGIAFVDAINQFAEIFWATKNIKTKKAKAPYAPGLEMIYPDL